MNILRNILLLFIGCCFLSACYTFKGTSIPPTTKTYFVEQFSVRTSAAPADLGQTFTQALIDKVRSESRLSLTETDPDIEFEGFVSKFEVTAINPEPDATVAANRLTIEVHVNYKTSQENDKEWQQNFSYFVDFPASQNLLDVQDQVTDEAFDQITEDIFNKAFTDW
jgi:hypothetical protein